VAAGKRHRGTQKSWITLVASSRSNMIRDVWKNIQIPGSQSHGMRADLEGKEKLEIAERSRRV